jgi:hypothetical protein
MPVRARVAGQEIGRTTQVFDGSHEIATHPPNIASLGQRACEVLFVVLLAVEENSAIQEPFGLGEPALVETKAGLQAVHLGVQVDIVAAGFRQSGTDVEEELIRRLEIAGDAPGVRDVGYRPCLEVVHPAVTTSSRDSIEDEGTSSANSAASPGSVRTRVAASSTSSSANTRERK